MEIWSLKEPGGSPDWDYEGAKKRAEFNIWGIFIPLALVLAIVLSLEAMVGNKS